MWKNNKYTRNKHSFCFSSRSFVFITGLLACFMLCTSVFLHGFSAHVFCFWTCCLHRCSADSLRSHLQEEARRRPRCNIAESKTNEIKWRPREEGRRLQTCNTVASKCGAADSDLTCRKYQRIRRCFTENSKRSSFLSFGSRCSLSNVKKVSKSDLSTALRHRMECLFLGSGHELMINK